MAESIHKVGVVGCGTMGSGICEIVARHGLDVAYVEVDDAAVVQGRQRIEGSLERQVGRGRLAEDERDAILGRIRGGVDHATATLSDCDLVVEAVPEELALKQAAFEQIDAVVRGETIIATNTSSLPVMDIAVHTRGPTGCSASTSSTRPRS